MHPRQFRRLDLRIPNHLRRHLLGLFKRTNGGVGWTQLNAGLTSPRVHTLAIIPSTPKRFYAGTMTGYSRVRTAARAEPAQLRLASHLSIPRRRPQNTQPSMRDVRIFQGTLSSAGSNKSTNGGSSGTKPLGSRSCLFFVIDLKYSDHYAGTMDNGVSKARMPCPLGLSNGGTALQYSRH